MATNWDKLTPEQRRKRAAELSKKPGTRASVPTKYLPGSYRQQRLMNQRLDQPVTEGSPITNRLAARERNAAVDLRYGTAIRENQATQQAAPQWYQQYRDLLKAAQVGTQQGFQQAVAQFGALQQGTQGQQGQQQQAAYQAEAQRLGQVADPNVAATQANAAAIRGANAGTVGSVIAAQGANANAYGQNQVANSGKAQIETLLQLVQKGTDLKKESGAYGATVQSDIYDRERKNVLENKAFGLDVQQAQISAADKAADNARADAQAQQQTSNRNQDLVGPGQQYTRRQWNAMSQEQKRKAIRDYHANTTNPPAGSRGTGGTDAKPATGEQRRAASTAIARARHWAEQYHAAGRPRHDAAGVLVNGSPGGSTTGADPSASAEQKRKYRQLINNNVKPADARRQTTVRTPTIPKVDQLFASVALDVAYDGHVSRANARKLHSMGYTVEDLGLPSYQQWRRRNNATSTPRRRNAPSGRPGQERPT